MKALDAVRKNIGATVSMAKHISDLFGKAGLPEPDFTGLFNLEAKECGSLTDGKCTFSGQDGGPQLCDITTCPLGKLVDEELKVAGEAAHSGDLGFLDHLITKDMLND